MQGGVAIEMLPRLLEEKKLDVANRVVFRLYINELAEFYVNDPASPVSKICWYSPVKLYQIDTAKLCSFLFNIHLLIRMGTRLRRLCR